MATDDKTIFQDQSICPPEQLLAEGLAGTLDDGQRMALASHLQKCPACRLRTKTLATQRTKRQQQFVGNEQRRFDNADTHLQADPSNISSGSVTQVRTNTNSLPPGSGEETIIGDTADRSSQLESQLPQIPGYVCESIIGRGGMGVVYRARQTALNRTVALKMIVTGRHSTLQQLARFHIEAEALACLTHENIVQIYEFGDHESGPYLALEYIEGQSLEAKLRQKSYTPREAAELCMLLAKAMHLAHSRGVVHRDLKPANILLTSTGQPKITDFGLAKRLSENSQWTQTDAVMGTPFYMAPEQAGGNAHAVGPLADVYALGTILYELLVGQPPFKGENLVELLNQICTEPPKSLRKQNPDVPRDLETICLRCLEKEETKRYQTAEDLADDLERYAENRPILARPVGTMERLAKWVKRRPAIAALLLGLWCLLMVIGVGGVVYNIKLRKERDLAETNFQLATNAVDRILADLSEETFLMEPEAEERRGELLQTALLFTKKLAEQKPENLAMRRNLGFCHRRMGDIHRLMGNYQAAQSAYSEAIAILTGSLEAKPRDREVTLQLAAAHNYLGELQRQTSRVEDARMSYRTALDLYDQVLAEDPNQPECQMESATVLNNLGILQKETAGAESDPQHDEKLHQARESLTRSIEILTGLRQQEPRNRSYARRLAQGYINLGSVMRLQKALRKGQRPFQLAIEQLEDLQRRYPMLAEYQFELAMAHNNLGNLLQNGRQYREAVAEYRLAEASFQRLVDEHPKLPQYRQLLASTYNSLFVALYLLGDVGETREALSKSILLTRFLIQDFPEVPDYHGDLGVSLGNLGELEMSDSHPAAAQEHLQAALPELRLAIRANPNQPAYLASSREVCWHLASVFIQQRKFAEASQQASELLASGASEPDDARLAAHFVAKLLAEATSANADEVIKGFQDLGRSAVLLYGKTSEGQSTIQSDAKLAPLKDLPPP